MNLHIHFFGRVLKDHTSRLEEQLIGSGLHRYEWPLVQCEALSTESNPHAQASDIPAFLRIKDGQRYFKEERANDSAVLTAAPWRSVVLAQAPLLDSLELWSLSGHNSSDMTHVGVREFRDHATRYLANDDIVAVERHGKVIGFYVPVPRADESERKVAASRLKDAAARAATEAGVSAEELATLLDPARVA